MADKSIANTELPAYRETRFRLPNRWERRLGLWVDRIGEGGGQGDPCRLRILGQYAVVAIDSGAGRYETRRYGGGDLRKGDVLLLTPAEPTTYTALSQWFMRWVVWNGPEARLLMDLRLLNQRNRVVPAASAVVHRAFIALAGLMDGADVCSALERKAVLLNMLAELRRRCSIEAGGRESAMAAVVDYIGGHLDEPLPVTELARMAHVSLPHFRRLFERYTGSGPAAFIADQRIARAKALLVNGIAIKETAARVGYPDPAYFMRVFRRLAGEPPGRFTGKAWRNSRGAKPK